MALGPGWSPDPPAFQKVAPLPPPHPSPRSGEGVYQLSQTRINAVFLSEVVGPARSRTRPR
jgi:hypothetical protein